MSIRLPNPKSGTSAKRWARQLIKRTYPIANATGDGHRLALSSGGAGTASAVYGDVPWHHQFYPSLTRADFLAIDVASGNWTRNLIRVTAPAVEAVGSPDTPFIVAQLNSATAPTTCTITAADALPTAAEYTTKRPLYTLQYIGDEGEQRLDQIYYHHLGDITDASLSASVETWWYSYGDESHVTTEPADSDPCGLRPGAIWVGTLSVDEATGAIVLNNHQRCLRTQAAT